MERQRKEDFRDICIFHSITCSSKNQRSWTPQCLNINKLHNNKQVSTTGLNCIFYIPLSASCISKFINSLIDAFTWYVHDTKHGKVGQQSPITWAVFLQWVLTSSPKHFLHQHLYIGYNWINKEWLMFVTKFYSEFRSKYGIEKLTFFYPFWTENLEFIFIKNKNHFLVHPLYSLQGYWRVEKLLEHSCNW